MTMEESIDRMSDYEAQQFIEKATIRLKEVAYAKGYKDGFNDAKNAEYFLQPVKKNNEPMQVQEIEKEWAKVVGGGECVKNIK